MIFAKYRDTDKYFKHTVKPILIPLVLIPKILPKNVKLKQAWLYFYIVEILTLQIGVRQFQGFSSLEYHGYD